MIDLQSGKKASSFTVYTLPKDSKGPKGWIALCTGYEEGKGIEREFLNGRREKDSDKIEFPVKDFRPDTVYQFSSNKKGEVRKGFFIVLEGNYQEISEVEAINRLGYEVDELEFETAKAMERIGSLRATGQIEKQLLADLLEREIEQPDLMDGEGRGISIDENGMPGFNQTGAVITVSPSKGQSQWMARMFPREDDPSKVTQAFVEIARESEGKLYYQLEFMAEGVYVLHLPLHKSFSDRIYFRYGEGECELLSDFYDALNAAGVERKEQQ